MNVLGKDLPFVKRSNAQDVYKRQDPDKLRPITFDPIHNAYRVLGEKVGNAFQDGTKLK